MNIPVPVIMICLLGILLAILPGVLLSLDEDVPSRAKRWFWIVWGILFGPSIFRVWVTALAL